MGNSPSSSQIRDGRRPVLGVPQRAAPSPPPGQRAVHRSLRHKKGSLELPDLQGYYEPQPIPIPRVNPRPVERAKNRGPSSPAWGSSLGSLPQPPPVPPPSINSNPSLELPDEFTDNQRSYEQNVVRSTLPLPLAIAGPSEEPGSEEIETPIVWNGGGSTVFLALANDMETLVPMERDGDRFIAKISLARGTHHLRFIVDDQSLVTDDMPKAVDDQGAMANYVSVGLSALNSPLPPPTTMIPPGHTPLPRPPSFWSSSSNGPTKPHSQVGWTNVIPLELTEAAAIEEAFITSYHANATTGGPRVPALPPAPMLPRHLEKQILNSGSNSNASNSSKEKRRGRHGHRHRADSIPEKAAEEPRVLPVTTASGTDISTLGPGAFTPNLSSLNEPPHILPVPSHVILNHLSTGSIRNRVLAVAETVRYKNKFVTTIYYKPT
ncbi:5'-AMP-activated protein kinase beta subunit, interation domain-containing protein [Mucidula mucida]|nr:5'-AMP-activated protein kinase beta subunit, interation domain-containing protein [Mucidula mucida]